MSNQNRVIWSQGLFLRPEHFQQEQRYLEFQQGGVLRNAFSYGWGLTQIDINAAELTNAQFALDRVSGTMADGLTFDTGVENNLPKSLDLKSFSRDLIIYLAITRSRSDAVQVSADDKSGQHRRYRLSSSKIVDVSHTGGESESIGPKETIEVAIPNLKLVSSEQNLEDLDCIPIARIKDVDSNGVAVMDDIFVPTCFSISCSSYLTRMNQNLESTITTLSRKISDIVASFQSTPVDENAAGINIGLIDNGIFTLLQTINRYSHLHKHATVKNNCHPEELYKLLLEFYCDISSFVYPHIPQSEHVKNYNHLDISESISVLAVGLDEKLIALIEGIDSFANYKRIEVDKPRPAQLEAAMENTEKVSELEPEKGGIVVPVGKKN